MAIGRNEIEKWNRAIREGRFGEVHAALSALKVNDVPRPCLAPLAQLAWRVGLPEWGVRALRPYVRVRKNGNEAECLEYGACLLRLGLLDEGLELLSTVSSVKHPRAALYRGFAWMTRWEYRPALVFLKRYLKSVPPRSYEAFTAKVNVAACLVFLREDTAATSLLRSLLHDTSLRGHRLLLGNALHLSASHQILTGQVTSALKLLDKAEEMLGQASDLDRFFISKWRALAALSASPKKAATRTALDRVKAEAAKVGHWETVRDCDRQWCLAVRDEATFRKLFFGTPFGAYRDRLVEEWGKDYPREKDYVWSGEKPVKRELKWLTGEGPLKPGQLPFRCLRELTRDAYRPVHPGDLFPRLFPGEYFDPDVSPHRVHEAVRRLREELQGAKDARGVSILFERNAYRIELAGVGLVVPDPLLDLPELSPARQRLSHAFSDGPFAAGAAARALAMPLRSAQRLLKELAQGGTLSAEGQGKGRRYRLKPPLVPPK